MTPRITQLNQVFWERKIFIANQTIKTNKPPNTSSDNRDKTTKDTTGKAPLGLCYSMHSVQQLGFARG